MSNFLEYTSVAEYRIVFYDYIQITNTDQTFAFFEQFLDTAMYRRNT